VVEQRQTNDGKVFHVSNLLCQLHRKGESQLYAPCRGLESFVHLDHKRDNETQAEYTS